MRFDGTVRWIKRASGSLAALLALMSLGLLVGCGKEQEAFSASGTFEAVDVVAGSLATGLLVSLNKEEGDLVARGELLASVDCEKLEIERQLVSVQLEETDLELSLLREKVSAGRISLGNYEKSLKRYQELHQVKSATDQQVDDLSTAVKLDRSHLDASLKELARPEIQRRELEARLKLLDRTIQDSKVVSPIDGQVIDRYAEPGEVVTVGTPLLRLADLKHLEIRVYLPAELLGEIKIGQELQLSADGAPGKEFKAKVAWVSPVAEFTPKNVQTPEARAELVYAVKLEVENEEGLLKIGMPADVFLPEKGAM